MPSLVLIKTLPSYLLNCVLNSVTGFTAPNVTDGDVGIAKAPEDATQRASPTNFFHDVLSKSNKNGRKNTPISMQLSDYFSSAFQVTAPVKKLTSLMVLKPSIINPVVVTFKAFQLNESSRIFEVTVIKGTVENGVVNLTI